ncbi:MAG: carbon-nitrogen hydrolase family protein [Lachnospira sp.]
MADSIKVVSLQILCDGKKQHMIDKICGMIDSVFKEYNKIDLLVLPEQIYQLDCNLTGEEYGEEPGQLFEYAMKQCASKYNVNIIAGSYAVKAAGKIYNRSLCINRTGDVIAHYDKIHLFDAFGFKESDTFSPGESLCVCDFDFGKVGVFICYDLRFPEISRALRKIGNVDLLCVPAAFYKPNIDQWETLIKSAAIYNVTPLVSSNQIGNVNDKTGFVGRSMAVDAKGVIIGGASDCEGYYYAKIDKNYTEYCRRSNPEFTNRRSDLYRTWA